MVVVIMTSVYEAVQKNNIYNLIRLFSTLVNNKSQIHYEMRNPVIPDLVYVLGVMATCGRVAAC